MRLYKETKYKKCYDDTNVNKFNQENYIAPNNETKFHTKLNSFLNSCQQALEMQNKTWEETMPATEKQYTPGEG